MYEYVTVYMYETFFTFAGYNLINSSALHGESGKLLLVNDTKYECSLLPFLLTMEFFIYVVQFWSTDIVGGGILTT